MSRLSPLAGNRCISEAIGAQEAGILKINGVLKI
jgi:hypothetical protein